MTTIMFQKCASTRYFLNSPISDIATTDAPISVRLMFHIVVKHLKTVQNTVSRPARTDQD